MSASVLRRGGGCDTSCMAYIDLDSMMAVFHPDNRDYKKNKIT